MKTEASFESNRFAYDSKPETLNDFWNDCIELKDKKYQVSIKPTGITEEETLKIEISPKEINKIEKILKENEIGNWNGFQKTDKNVLDGNSFSLSIRFTNNDSISASGYMKYPNNYKKVQAELDKFFMDIYNKNKT